MQFEIGRVSARVSATPARLAALALLLWAAGAGGARAAAVEVEAAAPNPQSPAIELVDRQNIPSITWKMAHDVPVWKTISLGTYSSINILLGALESDTCDSERSVTGHPGFVRTAASAPRSAPRCRLGDKAGEIIGRPAFHLSRTKQELDLVVVSLIELGFTDGESVALEEIYARADMLGYVLCPAEVGPLLRLEYLDQPPGEFLHVGMQPIAVYGGPPADFTVGNGALGLVLLGGDGRDNVTLPPTTRFVFVRRRPGSRH